MSGDHPLVRGALDLLLGAEAGNSAFGVWRDGGREAILLEVLLVVECVAPGRAARRSLSARDADPRRRRSRARRPHRRRQRWPPRAGKGRHLPPARSRRGEERNCSPRCSKRRGSSRRKNSPRSSERATAKMKVQFSRRDRAPPRPRARSTTTSAPRRSTATEQQQTDLAAALAAAHLRLDAVRLILRMP